MLLSHQPTSVRHSDGERGAGLVEYVMLQSLIALVCISAISYFGGSGNASVTHSKDCILAADGRAVSDDCRRD